MLLLMWMRCSYLIIELIRYFPFAFYLVLNFTCNMNKIKRVRWSHVYRTLDIDAPWFWKTDIKVTVLFLFERRICSIGNVNFFLFVTAVSVRIWVNYDAVLRYSRATMCGIAVFSRYHVRYCGIRTPLTPPSIIAAFRLSVTSWVEYTWWLH